MLRTFARFAIARSAFVHVALAPLAVALLAPLSLAAQDAPLAGSIATGTFDGPAGGQFYRAELRHVNSALALRVWTGNAPDALTLTYDNPRFGLAPLHGSAWLEATPEGPPVVQRIDQMNEIFHTSRILLGSDGDGIVVTRAEWFNNARPVDLPDDPFACFAAECWACIADLAGGHMTVAGVAAPLALQPGDLDARLWGPDRPSELGLCFWG